MAAKKMILQVAFPQSGASAYKTVAFTPTTRVTEARDMCALKGGVKEGKENFGLCIKDSQIWLKSEDTLEKYNLQNCAGLEFKLLPTSTVVTYEGETKNIDIDFSQTAADVLGVILEHFGEPKSNEFSLYIDAEGGTKLDSAKSVFEQVKPGCKLIVKKKSKIGMVFRRPESVKPKRDSSMASLIPSVTRIFGIPLAQVTHPAKYGGLPIVVAKTVEYLEETALELEGIFRISGNQSEVLALKKSFDEGQDVNIRECSSPHVAAGLLKLYIREMPEPLFSFHLYPIFIRVNDLTDEDVKILYYKVLIDALPLPNRVLINRILPFLAEVVKYEHINKMAIHNVATVFGPNMLRSSDNSAMVMIQGTAAVNAITCDLIKNYISIIEPADYDFCSIGEALYDYTANSESELSFKAGELVFVVKEDTNGWWEAEVEGRYGFVPTNYIKVLFTLPKKEAIKPQPQVPVAQTQSQSQTQTQTQIANAGAIAAAVAAKSQSQESSTELRSSKSSQSLRQSKGGGVSKQQFIGQLDELKNAVQMEAESNLQLKSIVNNLLADLDSVKQNKPSTTTSTQQSNSSQLDHMLEILNTLKSNVQNLKAENETIREELTKTNNALNSSLHEIETLKTDESNLRRDIDVIHNKIEEFQTKSQPTSTDTQQSTLSSEVSSQPTPVSTPVSAVRYPPAKGASPPAKPASPSDSSPTIPAKPTMPPKPASLVSPRNAEDSKPTMPPKPTMPRTQSTPPTRPFTKPKPPGSGPSRLI